MGQLASNPGGSTMDYGVAVLLTVGIAVLLGTIEALYRSDAGLKACFNPHFVIYLIIYSIGNTIGTLLAASLIGTSVPLPPFFHAAAGAFAFQGVLANSSLSVFDKGISLEPWLDKAKHKAIWAINKRELALKRIKDQRRIDFFVTLSETVLNTHLLAQAEGADALKSYEQAATKTADLDSRLYKSIVLVKGFPEAANAIYKTRKRRPKAKP